MSEYASPWSAERLLAKDDGRPSDFVEKVRQQPFVVVLLDEIEKAAAPVFDMLLGMLDEGRLTDRNGRTTIFRSAIVILTSNLAQQLVRRSASTRRRRKATPRPCRISSALSSSIALTPWSPSVRWMWPFAGASSARRLAKSPSGKGSSGPGFGSAPAMPWSIDSWPAASTPDTGQDRCSGRWKLGLLRLFRGSCLRFLDFTMWKSSWTPLRKGR